MSINRTARQKLGKAIKQPYAQTKLRFLYGAIGGLYMSRILAEQSPGSWPAQWLVLLVLAATAFGAALGYWLGSKLKLFPLLVLAIYLVWPLPRPDVAGVLAGIAGTMLLIYNAPSWPHGKITSWLIFAGSLALYTATLAPGLLPADSGEFQLTSAVLGIAHPPGYALYTMLGKLFTLLPFGTTAWRINWMSAVFSAATLALLYQTLERYGGSRVAAWIAVVFLGLSPTFWVSGTTANIRSLTALLTMLSVTLLLAWNDNRQSRTLAEFALVFGLGACHHVSLALLGIPYLAYIILSDPHLFLQPRRWLPAARALAASLLVLLYLPLRSAMQPAFDPAPIRTWNGFWQHILALGFKGDLVYFRSLPEIEARLGVGIQILTLQFGAILAMIAGLAFIPLIFKRWKTGLLLGGIFLVNGLAAITYRAPQTVEYLLPAYVSLALILGLGLAELWRWRLVQPIWQPLAAVILVLGCLNGWQTSRSMRISSQDDSTRIQAAALLEGAPQSAVILSNWHQVTPLWYLQMVGGIRPDVTIEYVYPEGSNPNEVTWLEHIAEWVDKRPVIVTNWFYGYTNSPYTFAPYLDAWLVSMGQNAALPAGLEPFSAPFNGGIELVGARIEPAINSFARSVIVTISWISREQQLHDLTSFVQILGPEGVIGQGDQLHLASRMSAGTLQTDRFVIALNPQALPGTYQVISGFYTYQQGALTRLTSEGQDVIVLGTYELQPSTVALLVTHQQSAYWENGLHLAGYSVDDSFGGQRRLYMQFTQLEDTVFGFFAPSRGVGKCQIQITADGQLLTKALPALAEGSYQLIAFDLPAGTRIVDVKVVTADGTQLRPLGAWHRGIRLTQLRLPEKSETYIPLADGITLTGVEAASETMTPASTAALRARFLAGKPITRDYSVSLGLRSAGGWEVKDDSTPALGAIPTLKWGWGWQVTDAHFIELPDSTPRGEANITVELYDAFTLRPLTVLDERRVREGQGTRLELKTIHIR